MKIKGSNGLSCLFEKTQPIIEVKILLEVKNG
jgi:hypothetical protein